MIRTKEILVAMSLSALLVGCVDSSTGAAAKADMGEETKVEAKATPAPKAEEKAPVAEKTEPAPVAATATPVEEATPAEPETPTATEEAAPAEAPVATETEAAPAAAAVNLSACAACHGAQFEKAAMGVSKVVKDLTQEEIVNVLKGYKAGTYGGAMKTLMQGQIAAFDDAMIEAAAAQIKQ